MADARNDEVLVYVNGAFVPRDEARVSVFDCGFVLGDGVWEGLRLVKGTADQPRRAPRPAVRRRDARSQLDIGLSREGVVKAVQRHARQNGMTDGAHIRLMVTRGVKQTPNQDPRFVIGKATDRHRRRVQDAAARGEGARAMRSSPRPSAPAAPTVFDLRLNSHSRAEPDPGADPGDQCRRRRGADARPARLRRLLQLDQLLHRPRPRAVDLDRRSTASRASPRRNVIDAWRAAGNVARECDFTLGAGLLGRRGVRDRNPGGVTPVTKVDGRLIADGKPGNVTKEASDLYLRSVGAL